VTGMVQKFLRTFPRAKGVFQIGVWQR